MEMTVKGRLVAAIGLVSIVVGAVWFLNSKTDAITKLASGTSKTLTVGINTWSGFAGVIVANKGLEANTNSEFFKNDGMLVDIKIFDDPNAGRQAFLSGDIDTWQGTVDSIPVDAKTLVPSGFKYFVLTDWSNGGDAIVAVEGIRNVSQLKGKKVAVAEGSPSHSLLLNVINSGELKINDITVVKVSDGSEAAKLFKAGAVSAAVVWSPDDQECLNAVQGSTVLVSTKKASRIIADALYTKSSFLAENKKQIDALVRGILNKNAQINSSEVERQEAITIMANAFNTSRDNAALGISNARLATHGDNLDFFGLNSEYKGVTGQELYDRMSVVYNEIGLAPNGNPNWRQIVDTSAVRDVQLAGAIHASEAVPQFAKVSVDKAQKLTAFSNKKLSVNFPTNSATLTVEAKGVIRQNFAGFAKSFQGARILIEGNSDNVGSDEINVPLSERRANSAKNFIVSNYGVDPNRITVVGNGSKYATGVDGYGRAQDRRTDFKLLND